MQGEQVIDTLEFAHSKKVLHGVASIASLDRLQDALAAQDGGVEYTLAGGLDGQGRPMLRLTLAGDLMLACQRCLEPLPFALEAVTELLLARDEAELERHAGDDEAPEAILADAALDVLALVEDEVLLALPLAPRHAEGRCPKGAPTAKREAPKAFAALAALKGKLN